MRAVMFHTYGPPDVLVQAELPAPVPKVDQVLVRVHATTVTVTRSSFAACRPVLAPRGCYLPTTGLVNNLHAWRTAVTGGPRVRTGMSVRKHAAPAELRELLARQRIRVVIDRTYPLDEIVQAHRYVDSGRKVGNVVITVTGS